EIVAPAIEEARSKGMKIEGPIGADTLIQRKGYDAYVVMLHDQGHVAAKLLAPNGAAALTIGTPVLFSSVAHGSALDIAGKGIADPAAMVEAITRLVGDRKSTRLNSSHQIISYAVFCLKKKKLKQMTAITSECK